MSASTIPSPSGWSRTPLGELGKIFSGSTPKREVTAYWQGKIPWVAPGELTNLREKYLSSTYECITDAGLASCAATLLPKDTLLITTRATLGSAALSAMPLATNQGFKSLVLYEGADPHFYYHLASRLIPEFTRRASGTTFLEISGKEFAAVIVDKPPLPEQHRIAEILDTLDEAIRKTELVIAKLQQMKQGLLHDLLTRGIDKNGELRDPERHPEQFKDSPLGRIPSGWDILTLGQEIYSLASGWSPVCDSDQPVYGQPGVLKTTAVVWDGFNANESKILPSQLGIKSAAEVRPDDVLITRKGPRERVGVVVYVRNVPPNLMAPDTVYRLTLLKGSKVLPVFLPLALGSEAVQRTWDQRKIGLAESQVEINHGILRRTVLPIPSWQEQLGILEVVNRNRMQIKQEVSCVDKLRAFKKGLMDDLLTGRVRVKVDETDAQ